MRYPIIWVVILILEWNACIGQSILDTLIWNGPSDNRINLVILGDGYRIEEAGKFQKDATDLSEYLFTAAPYKEYADFFNVVRIWTASNESGAARDPSQLIDNYYGSTYNFAGIERLLVPTKTAQAVEVLRNHFPSYDMVMMVVNDAKYGGSGGWLATTSTHSSAPEIAVHEIGHSFADLADEYWAGRQYARERPNMTQETSEDSIRWRSWLGTQGVGIYAFSEDMSWHRPHQNCKMRRLGPSFCAVCTENTVETIHSLVNTIDNFTPFIDSLEVSMEDSLLFAVELIRPQPNTLSSSWIWDGTIISENIDSQWIQMDTLSTGAHFLEYNVVDSTSYSRKDALRFRFHQVRWDIIKKATTSVHPNVIEWNYEIGPNPCEDFLYISSDSKFLLNLFNMNGQRVYSEKFSEGGHSVECGHLGNQFVVELVHDHIRRRHVVFRID